MLCVTHNQGTSDWPGRNLAIRPECKKINLGKVKRNKSKTAKISIDKMGIREIAVEWKLVVWASMA